MMVRSKPAYALLGRQLQGRLLKQEERACPCNS